MIYLRQLFSTYIQHPVCYYCIWGDFMHRIENYYKWKTLKHWKVAIEAGAVRVKIIETIKPEDFLLEKAIELLENNCFPVTIICYQNEEKQREIWLTSLWTEIFDFLENGRRVRRDGKETGFAEMEADEQNAVLNARIESIWIAED